MNKEIYTAEEAKVESILSEFMEGRENTIIVVDYLGNIRGIYQYKDHDPLVVIGRNSPSVKGVEDKLYPLLWTPS